VCAILLSTCCAVSQETQCHLQDSIPDAPSSAITGKQRLTWVVKGTVGPQSLATGIFTAGIQTAENRPREYGPHWEGFGKRYGLRLTGVATEHLMEAGLGALWGEDPRYFRAVDHAFSSRVKNAIVMTVVAPRADGHLAPAYARLIAMPASNFLSNTWRPGSIANTGDAAGRTVYGLLGRLAGNSFAEFWPDVKKRVFHSKQ
jgi:hypothetical protein